jgi:8-oxo-dGTP diphosphatase
MIFEIIGSMVKRRYVEENTTKMDVNDLMKRVDVTYVLLYDELGENVLMVKNTGKNGSYYTLPGCAVEPGETLEEAAIREAKEETGLDVEIGDVFSVSEGFFEDRGQPRRFIYF